jgi:hypothetical protein
MLTRTRLILTLGACLCVAPPLRAQSTAAAATDTAASHVRAAERLLTASNAEQMVTEQNERTLKQQMQMMPQLAGYSDIMRDFMQKYASYTAIKPLMIRAYTATFTEQELDQLVEFYKTPLGKMVMERMPKLMEIVNADTQARIHAAMPELMQKVQARMMQQGAPSPQ